MAIPVYNVASLSDYIERVFRLQDEWQATDIEHAKKCGEEQPDPITVWFRGQGNARWPLQPKLYRSQKNLTRTKFAQSSSCAPFS